jgi:hypothetical protein
MTEIIDCTRNDAPGIFLIEAIAATEGLAGSHGFTDRMVKVEFSINGVPMPFEKIMLDMWARASKVLDRELLEKAQELVTEAALDGLTEAVRDAERKIKQALAEALDNRRVNHG